MGNWPVKTLLEVVELQRGFDLPVQSRRHGKIPVFGSNGIIGTHDASAADSPGVFIGRSGVIGGAHYVQEPFWPLNTTLFAKDFKANEPRWVYYVLKSIDFSRFDSGSAQPSLNRNYIANIPISVPPLAEQRAIAATLGALDDKIESNRRQIALLRELASAHFNEAMATGHRSRVKVAELVHHRPGKYLAKDQYGHGDFIVYGSNSVMGSHDKFLYEGPFAVLARIGSYCGALTWSEGPAWVNNNASALIPYGESTPSLVRQILNQIDMSKFRSGSGQPFIEVTALMDSEVEIPDRQHRLLLGPILEAVSKCEQALEIESTRLVSLRDALLPELLSGRIRVADAA